MNKLTADTITDEQILALLAEPDIDPPKHVSRYDKTDWAWFRREVYRIALGNGQGREGCRARCAEILNARRSSP